MDGDTRASVASEEIDDDAPLASPPRFEPTGPTSSRPEFQAVRVKAPVGAKIDLVVRSVGVCYPVTL